MLGCPSMVAKERKWMIHPGLLSTHMVQFIISRLAGPNPSSVVVAGVMGVAQIPCFSNTCDIVNLVAWL